MRIDLSGRTALVTGSTEGIGLACIRAYLGANAAVVVNGRAPDRVASVVDQLRNDFPGAQISGVAADLGTAGGCRALTEAVPRCDILVNNVGVIARDDALEASDELYLKLFELNFMSSLRMSRAYLPGMIERGCGRVLFSGAQRPLMAYKGGTAYSASKFAQLNLARSLAELTRGTAVTVNTVLIGITHSASLDDVLADLAAAEGCSAAEYEKEFIAMVSPGSLIDRLAFPEEIASFLLYLSSPFASATNGAVLSAEGGTRPSVA